MKRPCHKRNGKGVFTCYLVKGGDKLLLLQLKEKCEFWETSSRFILQSLGLCLPMYIYMHL